MAGVQKRAWGVDTYGKWDKLEEDDLVADECKDGPPAPTAMQFAPGQSSLKVRDVDLLDAQDDKRKRLRGLPQDRSEVWQVVVRKLRVWAAGANGEPCRPWCVMISQLYPEGKLVGQHVCSPPDQYPAAKVVIDYLLEAMLNPVFGAQRRPQHVTLPDAALAGDLFRSLEKLGVQVSELSESEGVDEVVARFSEMLVKKEVATVGPAGDRPGLLAGRGVSEPLVRSFFATSKRFAAAAPWAALHERRSFQLTVAERLDVVRDPAASRSTASCSLDPGPVWVSVLGHDAWRQRSQAVREGNDGGGGGGGGGGVFGIALFFSRLDMEARMVPHGEEVFEPASEQEERCSYTGKSAAELGHELKRTKPRKMDVRTGKELLFADSDALRKLWPSVRKYAVALDELEQGRKARREHWLGIECTVLFESATCIPFDDLDAIDRLGLEQSDDPNMYPLALAFNKGVPERPSGEQLAWLHLAMSAVLERCSRGELEAGAAKVSCGAFAPPCVAVDCTPAPVFFASEARAAAARKRAAHAGSTSTKSQDEEKAVDADVEEGDAVVEASVGQREEGKGEDNDEAEAEADAKAEEAEAAKSGCVVS